MAKHYHACHECYEYWRCDDGCAIEHDLGEKSGLPMGSHAPCPQCEPVVEFEPPPAGGAAELAALRAAVATLTAERDAARDWARRWKRGASHLRLSSLSWKKAWADAAVDADTARARLARLEGSLRQCDEAIAGLLGEWSHKPIRWCCDDPGCPTPMQITNAQMDALAGAAIEARAALAEAPAGEGEDGP